MPSSRWSMRLAVPVAMLALAAFPASLQSQVPQPTDQQVFETFRDWVNRQPAENAAPVMERYRTLLASQGLPTAEIDRRLKVIDEQGRKLEVERWNRILTAPSPSFRTKPNAFLVQMVQGRKPGRALDVGMGQGRNAIYLAQQGWAVTGFDPAGEAVAAARAEASRLGLSLTTYTVGDEDFDFGREQWDLILFSYVGVRHLVGRLLESLRPGGIVVVEAFHKDATKTAAIGGGVVFDSNELLRLFDRYRVIHYEDIPIVGDFGLTATGGRTGVVRLAVQRP